MMIQDIFIDRLKKAMAASDVNARELAKRSGLTEASISRYLSGKMEPRVPAIAAMAKALHVDPTWLLGYDTTDSPDFSIETGKIAMLIEMMTSDEKKEVERFAKFIIENRGDSK